VTMLETTERMLKAIRQLQVDTEQMVLNGSIADMERYRFLMGRLEGIKMVEQSIKDILKKGVEDEDF
jgi:hypothetical protein